MAEEDRLELYEDNSGSLYWVEGDRAIPIGSGDPGMAKEDAELWDEWAGEYGMATLCDGGADDEVEYPSYPTSEMSGTLIAIYHRTPTYRGGAPRKRRFVTADPAEIGVAGRAYLGDLLEGGDHG